MANKSFSEVFASNMESLGLPVPTSLYGTLAATLATVGALAGAITKVGAGATVSEIFLTAPLGVSTAASAAATSEIVAVCGAVSASFYVGACIGSALIAAYETLNLSELAGVVSWANALGRKIAVSLSEFMEMAVSSNARLSPIRNSVVLAKKSANAPIFAPGSTGN